MLNPSRRVADPADAPTTSDEAPTGIPAPPTAQPTGGTTKRLLPVIGLVVSACATLPVQLGPHLDVAHRVEVADHLIPGLVSLAVSATVLVMTRRAPVPGFAMLAAGLVVTLAGLWMVATHLPLVAQAGRHDAPWGATIYHSASAVLVLVFGLVWTTASWADAG